MLLTAEQKCCLWLSAAEITPGTVQKAANAYGGVLGIWDAFGRESGPQFRAKAHQELARLHSRDAIDDLQERLEKKNVHLLFLDDDAYPALLREIPDPPYLLYYAGRLSCLKRPMVGVVGSRKASDYGKEVAAQLARGLCEAGVCVVSGLARGIDEAAHEAALRAGGCTIGVLGSGINVPYPPEHTQLLRRIAGGIGLIISEYPLDAEPHAFHFPHRNRIISGLSQGVVFVEGRVQSGGMHTVQAALVQGRQVFAVPGRIGTSGAEGPHTILREGARIVTSAADLLDDLGLLPEQKSSPEYEMVKLEPLQKRIVAVLKTEPLTQQEIEQKLTDISPVDLMTELGTLEILGVVHREAGNRFHLPILAGQ